MIEHQMALFDEDDLVILDLYREIIDEYRSAKKLLDAQTTYVHELRDHLLGLIGDKRGASVDGALVLRRISARRPETVDKTLLKERWPEAYQACVHTPDGETVRLTLVS